MTIKPAEIKKFPPDRRAFSQLLFAIVCLSFFVVSSSGCSKQQVLTEQERTQIAKFIPELEIEKKKIHKRIEHRRSIGGLHDVIGPTSFETWSQRYSSSLNYYDSILRAFKQELELGTKVAPPARFRKSMGYRKSKYRRYFIH